MRLRKLMRLGMMGGGGAFTFTDAFDRADGAVANGWTGNWLITSGTCGSDETPGADMMTNGDMETGDPPTGYTSVGGGVLSRDTDTPHGGSAALRVTKVGGNYEGAVLPAIATTVGHWGRYDYYYAGDNAGLPLHQFNRSQTARFSGRGQAKNATTAWKAGVVTGRVLNASCYPDYVMGGSAGRYLRLDDILYRELTLTELFLTREFTSSYGVSRGFWSISGGTISGVVMCLDDPANPKNFVAGYGINTGVSQAAAFFLTKCVNGTYTDLINATPGTYTAGAALELRRAEGTNVFQLYYNGVQIGANQTIADAGIINNKNHGLFSTYSGNTATEYFYSTNF